MTISGLMLLLHFRGRNAVWGGTTMGIVVGVAISFIKYNRVLLAWSFSIGTLSGAFFEWLGRGSQQVKRRYLSH